MQAIVETLKSTAASTNATDIRAALPQMVSASNASARASTTF